MYSISIFYFTFYSLGGGAYTHPTHPPAYGPEAIDRNDSKTQVVKQRFLDGSVAGSGRGPDVACERRAASWTTLSYMYLVFAYPFHFGKSGFSAYFFTPNPDIRSLSGFFLYRSVSIGWRHLANTIAYVTLRYGIMHREVMRNADAVGCGLVRERVKHASHKRAHWRHLANTIAYVT